MLAGEPVSLVGKDFLTEDEAALYCCVAKSTFCQHARNFPRNFPRRHIARRGEHPKSLFHLVPLPRLELGTY